jgi:DNA-directed RNA polymerase specialized sigma24 family protein
MTLEAGLIRSDSLVTDLMTRARNGDRQMWNALVEQYSPLIGSVCRQHQLTGHDSYNVAYRVWLQLLDQDPARLDPASLPAWIAAITQQECARTRREPSRTHDPLIAQRRAALREAFARLSPPCQQLISRLSRDPPLTHAQISAELGIPITCLEARLTRCLETLRQDPALATLIDATQAGRASR